MAEFVLKDWHGKDKTFDHDTIYVRDSKGKLLLFTQGSGNGEIDDILDAINGEIIGETLYTVTFKSYDGSETYGAIQVVENDNCPDPVTTKVFGKPQRESTAQYDFNHIGWSRTAEGERENGVLLNITSDITLYAAFSSTVRYYTITFYDGTTVLKEQTLAYGAKPSISNPEKYGWLFDKWEPSITTVTGNASYYAKWLQGSFSAASWSDIADICEKGKATEYFNVGDEKILTLGGQNVAVKIAGFNHDELVYDSGYAAMSIVLSTVVDQEYTNTEAGPLSFWNTSNLRTTIDGLYDKLPKDLQLAIKYVRKEYDNGYSNKAYTHDRLWALSSREIGRNQYISGSGNKYDLFEWGNNDYLTKFNSTTGVTYYLRDSMDYGIGRWECINADGSYGSVRTGEAAYLHFGFCI